MTLDTLIMLSGAFVALLPFLGFPNSWDRILFLLAGAFIVILGIIARRRLNERIRRTISDESASRNDPVRSAESLNAQTNAPQRESGHGAL